MSRRFIGLFVSVVLTVCGLQGARAQQTLEVLGMPVAATVGFGSGGAVPVVNNQAASPTGKSVDVLQPASYVEWRVACNTPGLYRIGISMAQWLDPGAVLAFETHPATQPDDPFATRYATRDTRDYGQTNGPSNYIDLGDVEDADGQSLTVPLDAGDNIFRLQNVTGRHNPAYSVPPDLRDTHAREWDFYWSDVHIGRLTLTRIADLPVFGTVSGRVTGDRPASIPVRRALVTASPPLQAPPEPSGFWKNGYYTFTRDDGTYTLRAPAGDTDIKAGRPSSYQAQGSPVVPVTVPAGGTVGADLSLASIFHDDGQGRQVAEVQSAYADAFTGALGLLAVDGTNGYKVGWVEPGDACTLFVDAPRTGYYTVTTSYFNGGAPGTVRISAGNGSSTQAVQPTTDWPVQGLQSFAQPLYLVQGTNAITQTLVSGASDFNSIFLTMPAVTLSDAQRALRIAAGLLAGTPNDAWEGTLTGGPEITVTDAVRLAQAANGRPL